MSLSLKGLLEVKDKIIKRSGPLSYIESEGLGIIVNPSEVLANEDEINVNIEGKELIITDQSYTKILSNSNVKINYLVSANLLFFFPHPTIFYNNSNVEIYNEIRVGKFAKIVEAYILGRKGHGEDFNKGNIRIITKVYYKDKLLIYDVFRVKDESYKNKNIMGSEALLSVYEVKNGEYEFNKFITTSEKIDTLWRKETSIWF